MKNKNANIDDLVKSLSLDLSYLEAMGVNIKSQLHENVIRAALNIILTSFPQEKEGESYEPTDVDKKRDAIKEKVSLFPGASHEIESAEKVESILRVHFEFIQPE